MEKVLKKLLHTEKNLPRLGKLPRCLEDVMGPEIPQQLGKKTYIKMKYAKLHSLTS